MELCYALSVFLDVLCPALGGGRGNWHVPWVSSLTVKMVIILFQCDPFHSFLC